jgi:hypothetical protein
MAKRGTLRPKGSAPVVADVSMQCGKVSCDSAADFPATVMTLPAAATSYHDGYASGKYTRKYMGKNAGPKRHMLHTPNLIGYAKENRILGAERCIPPQYAQISSTSSGRNEITRSGLIAETLSEVCADEWRVAGSANSPTTHRGYREGQCR